MALRRGTGLRAELWSIVPHEEILLKVELRGTNYCHLRFPAMREETLSSNRPVLKDPPGGDIVDFYGPCDYDPVGKAEVK